ncbi:MAG TPA: thermopsin family protease, partial [Thermoplasmata archaeon]|nr:thermopsin family protease [Thermoplasmata archaeon]
MIGVTIGLILSLGLPVLAGTGAHASAGATPAPVRPSVGAASPTSTSAGANPSNPGSQMASSALAATKAAGLKANVVFVPRPSASADQLAAARETGTVSPLYTASPAPMGLADYGLSNGSGGRVVGSILNTTSVVATVDMNATGVSALDLFDSSPDSYGIQLNAVLTNVTLFGTPGFSFWTQNVVEYYPATHYLVLVTNVWNFSSAAAAMTPNTLYGHGVWGTNYSGLLGYYYAQYAVPTPVYYPFNLTLYLNSTTNQGRDAVYFTVLLKSAAFPREDLNSQQITYAGGPDRGLPAPYDDVIFNSLANATPPLTVGSNYTANGLAYNPIGLTNDFELIFGGPGGGSQATLFDADATLGLATWDGSAYVSVPSAYSYGGETGETVTGANVAWSNGAGGPF